jgi:hypothetical protein
MARIVGKTGYVKINGSTVANIIDWQFTPAQEFGERRGWGDSSADIILIHTSYSGSFTVERNDTNGTQEAVGTTAGSVTLILNNDEDSYTISAFAWQAPRYAQGEKVTMQYQFRDRG